MDFKHENNRFTVMKDAEELGYISYIPDGDVLTVDHTEVSPKLEGQGVGKQLVEQVVQYARQEGKKIDPQCPFAHGVIEKTPDFQDVVAK
ncbi:Acetyltransferase (GNAT) family protein [Planococcus massiliensis]|uniref:Acetyltransferase (GNAT) family protein n=1 Tax=Planococcus massiliensis TaxID=1499687 RepID=A0A098ES82_9BACL|nr:GNAT family N-acetyltransferase [Planococcus massiliensis]MCJ1909607.1 N-acetyltransferase [Planococcus ruber]CEG24171.1 Acetyltransferase (GNAT) family protein [Planococcus massiliensis]